MRALNRDEPRPVILFANRGEPEQIEAALEAGVAAYVVEGLTPSRIRPVIEVAIRRFRAHQALREELETTRATLAVRRVIDAAKARLMERAGSRNKRPTAACAAWRWTAASAWPRPPRPY